MDRRAALAVDVGGTKTLCSLIGANFKIVAERKFSTAPENGRKKFVQHLVGASEKLARKAKHADLKLVGVGLGLAGRVNCQSGTVETSKNILPLEGLDVGKVFRRSLGLKTVIGNDVQFALHGEQQIGVAAGCSHVLGVFFGTGVGGAMIVDGKIYTGAGGVGGNVGWILAQTIGGADALESHGTLDRIASKASIAGAALALGARQRAPYLYEEVGTDLAKFSWGALRRSIRAGDKAVEDLLRMRMRVAGVALSNVVNFMNPEMLVLGGGLVEELPRLVLAEIKRGLAEYLKPEVSKPLQVKLARFKNRAGVIGAAKRAFEKFS